MEISVHGEKKRPLSQFSFDVGPCHRTTHTVLKIDLRCICCPMEFMETIQVPNEQVYLEVLCGELDFSKDPFIFMNRLLISANKHKNKIIYVSLLKGGYYYFWKNVENG